MSEDFDKHRFQRKGQEAEQVVHDLAYNSFLKQWSYPNPKFLDGNKEEVCDLLILCEPHLIIVQIKDITFKGNDDRYIREAFDKPAKQVLGTERALLDLRRSTNLVNAHGYRATFIPDEIEQVFRLVVSVGDGEVPFNMLREEKGKLIHTFDKSIEGILSELDTLPDFLRYLKEKEKLSRDDYPNVMAFRELDIVGDYIFHDKSFDQHKGFDIVNFDDGIWEYVINHEKYQAKKRADKNSYFCDGLIEIQHKSEGNDQNREFARRLSKLNRFERRYFASQFKSAWDEADSSNQLFLRILEDFGGMTCAFLFVGKDMPRLERVSRLKALCHIARNKYRENATVLGLATDKNVKEYRHSFDCALLDRKEWSKEDEETAEMLQRELSMLIAPKFSRIRFTEYPANPLDNQ